MALLAGTTSIFSGKAVSAGKETVVYCKVKASETGKATSFEVREGTGANGTATSYELGIVADNAGKPSSTVIATAKGKEAAVKETWLKASEELKEGEVVSGTEYWLAVLPLGGNLVLEYEKAAGGANHFKSTKVNLKKISEATEWTEVAEGLGPFDMAVLGTAGAAKTFTATGTIVVGAKAPASALQTTGAATGIKIGSKATFAAAATLTAQTGITLSAKATDQMIGTLEARTGIRLGAQASVKVVTVGGKKIAIWIFEE